LPFGFLSIAAVSRMAGFAGIKANLDVVDKRHMRLEASCK
jgi:hypothetical protein